MIPMRRLPGEVVRLGFLDPPLQFGGRTFVAAARLPVDGTPKDVVTLRVHSYDPATGRVVFERGTQSASYIITDDGPGTVTEVVYDSATGGNAVDTLERDRIYSVHNPMARRGSMASERAIPGDALVRRLPGDEAVFEFISCDPYWQSGPVDYVPTEDRRTAYSENPGTGLVLEGRDGFAVDFETEGSGVATWDGVNAPVELGRVIFGGDPFLFPDDGVLGGGYYLNPVSREIRFGSGVTTGHTAFAAYWLLAESGDVTVPASEVLMVDGTAGFAPEVLEFDVTLTLLTEGSLTIVTGSGSQDLTPPGGTYPVAVRVLRELHRLRAFADGSPTPFLDVAGPRGGCTLRVSGTGARFITLGLGDPVRVLRFDGELRVQGVVSAPVAQAASAVVPDGFALVAVERAHDARGMVEGASGRDGYVRSGSVVTFRREAEGDLVRLRLAPTGPRPPAPGLGLPTFDGQEGLSEIVGADVPTASTDPSKNRVNWRDAALVAAAFGRALAPGDEVVVVRGRTFAPSDATCQVFTDIAGNADSDWAAMPSSKYLFEPLTGTVLFEAGALPELAEGESLCVRFDVSKRYRRGHHAELYEETRKMWGHLDTLYARPGDVGGPGIGFHGQCIQRFGPSRYELVDAGDTTETWWPADFVWGLPKEDVHGHYLYDDTVPEYIARSAGHFRSDLLWSDLFLRTPPPGPANWFPIAPPAGPIPIYSDHWRWVEGEGAMSIGPFGPLDEPLSFGSDYPFPEPETNGPYGLRFGGANVVGIRFDAGRLIGALPAGSDVLKAWMPVRFVNARSREWIWEGLSRIVPGSSEKYGYMKATVNGRVLIWNEFGGYDSGRPGDWEPEDFLDTVPGGRVTLDLVGSRFDSRVVHTYDNPDRGAEVVLPRRRLVSGLGGVGSDGTTQVGNDGWAMVDVTRAFRTAYRLAPGNWQELFLFPSVGAPVTSQDPDTLGAYLQGLSNTNSMVVSDDAPNNWTLSGTAEGRIVFYDTVQVGPPLVRFRVGGGKTWTKRLRGIVPESAG